jgi:hypothetical protein
MITEDLARQLLSTCSGCGRQDPHAVETVLVRDADSRRLPSGYGMRCWRALCSSCLKRLSSGAQDPGRLLGDLHDQLDHALAELEAQEVVA